MIESFEFEPIRLAAPLPTRTQGKEDIGGKNSVDLHLAEGVGQLQNREKDVLLDNSQIRVFQTKIGNPDMVNSHFAQSVQDHLLSMGTLVVDNEQKTEPETETKSVSEILSSYLDSKVQFIPAIDKHILPPMNVVSMHEPFLTPGLTSIDGRKLKLNLNFSA